LRIRAKKFRITGRKEDFAYFLRSDRRDIIQPEQVDVIATDFLLYYHNLVRPIYNQHIYHAETKEGVNKTQLVEGEAK